MYINGEWLDTGAQFEVENPATGEVIGQVADGNRPYVNDVLRDG